MPGWTLKKIYDTVREHLLKQGEPATDGIACLYKYEEDGKVLRCAVGCLITDEAYDTADRDYGMERANMDEQGPWSALVASGVLESGEGDHNDDRARLLEKLQDIHDRAVRLPPEAVSSFWKEKLDLLAARYAADFRKEAEHG